MKETWAQSNQLKEKQKVDRCRTAIIKWSKQQRESNLAQLEKLKKSIEDETIALAPNVEMLDKMKLELLEAYKTEENYWKQRSRQLWLHLGDKNTGFFHASTKKEKLSISLL